MSNSIFIMGGIIFFIIIVIGIIFIFLKPKNNDNKYHIKLPYSENGLNTLNCPAGCNRGRCDFKNQNKKNHCKYDFQCNYCNNKNTNMMYIDPNNNRKLIPVYEESQNLTKNQKGKLNNSINEYNNDIEKINKTVSYVNKANESHRLRYNQ